MSESQNHLSGTGGEITDHNKFSGQPNLEKFQHKVLLFMPMCLEGEAGSWLGPWVQ